MNSQKAFLFPRVWNDRNKFSPANLSLIYRSDFVHYDDFEKCCLLLLDTNFFWSLLLTIAANYVIIIIWILCSIVGIIIIIFSNFKQIHVQTIRQFCRVFSQQKSESSKCIKIGFVPCPRLFFRIPPQIHFKDWRKTYEEKIYEASDQHTSVRCCTVLRCRCGRIAYQ